jgi:phage shock protein C
MANDFVNRIKQRIQLDKNNGWIFGVCAGLANSMRLDPTFVRVGVIVSGLFFPKLVVASYLLLWLLLDERSVLHDRGSR